MSKKGQTHHHKGGRNTACGIQQVLDTSRYLANPPVNGK